MKGFLLRDLFHLAVSLRLYCACLSTLIVITLLAKEGAFRFILIYIVMFASSALTTLFNYDVQEPWASYALSVPQSRRAQPNARYLLTFLTGLGIFLLSSSLSILGQVADGLTSALLYTGIFFVYVSIMLPLNYRFGDKSRLIILLLALLFIGGITLSGCLELPSNEPPIPPTALLLAGAILCVASFVGFLVSLKISHRILERKEL